MSAVACPVTRIQRLRALLPIAAQRSAEMRDGDLTSQRRADATRAYVDAVDEVVDHLLALEERGALQDAEDVITFAYGGTV